MLITKNLLKKITGLALVVPFVACTAVAAPDGGSPDAMAGEKQKGPEGAHRPVRPERMFMGGRDRMMQGGGPSAAAIFPAMLSRPEFLKEMGLPEDVAEKIMEALKKFSEQEQALFEERQKLMKEQTDAMAALMSDRTKDGEEVRKVAAELEAVQLKLFGLRVDRMLVIRDNLTDEQIKQASELVKKRFESRREEMMRRRGRGPEGEGPRGRGPRGGFGNNGAAVGEKDAPPPPPPQPKEGMPAQEATK